MKARPCQRVVRQERPPHPGTSPLSTNLRSPFGQTELRASLPPPSTVPILAPVRCPSPPPPCAPPPPWWTLGNHLRTMRSAVGRGLRARGSPPPPPLSPALVTAGAPLLFLCLYLLFLAALPRPVAADCPSGDVLLSSVECARVCSTSLFFPCTSPFGLSCASWFWRRSCCRSSPVRTCANGRVYAVCYCNAHAVRPAGIVLIVAAALGALVGIAALMTFLVRRRKARAAAVPPAAYGGGASGGFMPPPPPPAVHGYPAGGGGYPPYPPPAEYSGWGEGGSSGAPPPGYPATSAK